MKVNLPETENTDLFVLKNEQTFSMIYDQYSAALYGIIMRKVNNEAVANNLLQKSFVTIWNDIENYDSSKDRLFMWLIKKTTLTTDQFKSSANNMHHNLFEKK